MIKLIMIFSFAMSFTFGQHFSASLGKNGLDKIIESGINSYSESQNVPTYVIPSETSHLTITKEEINSYEIVSEIKKYVNIDLSKDFHYSLSWSPMTVEFNLKRNSYKYDFEGNSQDFTVWAKAQIESIRVTASRFEICETLKRRCNKESGAYAKIENFSIELKDRSSIDAVVALNIVNSDDKVLVKNTALYSSLFFPKTKKAKSIFSKFGISKIIPALDIHFSDIIIPAPVLTVGNKKVKLNTSGLKNAILSQKEFLASQLLHIIGGFISTDLSEIVTTGIMGDLTEITKRINLFNFTNSVIMGPVLEENVEENYVSFTEDYKNTTSNISSELLSMVVDMVNYTEVDLEYLTLRASDKQSLAFDYNIHAELNNRNLTTKTSILNGLKKFESPKFEEISKSYDVALAIGEPFLNGVLESAMESGIVEKIFKEKAGIPGLEIKDLNVHFDQKSVKSFSNPVKRKNLNERNRVVVESTAVRTHDFLRTKNEKKSIDLKKYSLGETYNTGTFTLVASVRLDLSKVESNTTGEKFKNFIASTLESNIVWFPIELKFRPVVKFVNGISHLSLTYIANDSTTITNSYGYLKKDMYGVVEEGIVSTLKESLFDELKNEIQLDISEYIRIPGLRATPVGIEFLKSGHMSLLLDVNELDLKELVDNISEM